MKLPRLMSLLLINTCPLESSLTKGKETLRNADKPWITKGLKNSVRTKFKLYKKAKKTGYQNHWSAYLKYMNVLTRTKQKAKHMYYKELSILYGQNKSKTWKMINDISNRKRKSSQSRVDSLKDKSGTIIEDPLKISNCLNNHFSTVGSSMANEINSQIKDTKDPLTYIRKNVQNSLFMNYTSISEILNCISKMDNKKSSGYDCISNSILKCTNHVIAPYLETLYNSCIYHGLFPDAFKIAQVIPLFKGGDKQECSNYRPISLLPTLGKLLEKLLSTRLTNHLNANDILSKHQFGFRKNPSTESELAVNDINEKLLPI